MSHLDDWLFKQLAPVLGHPSYICDLLMVVGSLLLLANGLVAGRGMQVSGHATVTCPWAEHGRAGSQAFSLLEYGATALLEPALPQ